MKPTSESSTRPAPFFPSLCILIAVLNFTSVHAAQPPTLPSPPLRMPLTAGEKWAREFCGACHLFPQPEWLDRATWRNHSLRRMAPLLGVARLNLENRPDGTILKQSGLFPDRPLLTEEQWTSIVDYYLSRAPDQPLPQNPRDPIQPTTPYLLPKLTSTKSAKPMTTLVQFDHFRKKIWVGNGTGPSLDLFSTQGQREQQIPLSSPPVRLVIHPSHLDAALIGNIFPSDERRGSVVRIHENPDHSFSTQPLFDGLARPTDLQSADINRDGRPDFIVTSFGNYLGRVCWYESKLDGTYTEHIIQSRPGGLGSVIRDWNQDGLPDLLVLMGQAREGVFAYENLGGGDFEEYPKLQFHPIYGSTHMEVVDFNGDGHEDLLLTNGDNGEYPSPFKAYHGVRIYLNDGRNQFKEAFFYPMHGAFKAVAADLDLDGDLDIAAISFFPDYQKEPDESVLILENRGGLQFRASAVPQSRTGRWLTLDAADWDEDGDIDLILGSFTQGPPATPIPDGMRKTWLEQGNNILMLENLTRRP